ncbi:MAG: hypothetical protein JSS34_02445 [Proteobacteria bacterium]|nr:hypothetical protein [Pseudomonadota bacterium]
MLHAHFKKICALSILLGTAFPAFSMEEEGEAERHVPQPVVHIKGDNMEFKDGQVFVSPFSVAIESKGDLRMDGNSSIEAPMINVISENADLQGHMTTTDALEIRSQGSIHVEGRLKAEKIILMCGGCIENHGIIRCDFSEKPHSMGIIVQGKILQGELRQDPPPRGKEGALFI